MSAACRPRTKHLAAGSKARPLKPGKIRLNAMRFCPYAQRIHILLDAKKIPYDVVYINLTDKPEWLFEKNPLGKVPLVELENGDILYESLIIADYLDETYPEPRLHSSDPLVKAKDRLLIEKYGSDVISLIYKIYYTNDKNRELFDGILTGLETFEKELAKRGTPYFGGEKPGMLDYMIWPHFERLDLIKFIKEDGGDYTISPERFPKLIEWSGLLKVDEAVKGTYLDGETHSKFIRSKIEGNTQYDLLNNH